MRITILFAMYSGLNNTCVTSENNMYSLVGLPLSGAMIVGVEDGDTPQVADQKFIVFVKQIKSGI